jgi:hypothetical protein
VHGDQATFAITDNADWPVVVIVLRVGREKDPGGILLGANTIDEPRDFPEATAQKKLLKPWVMFPP